MNKVFAIVAVAVVLVVGYVAVGPFVTLYGIQQAVNDKDAEALRDNVDFPALRESVKGQFTAAMTQQMKQSDTESNGFAALGAGLAMLMVDKAVDQFVTPEGLTALLANDARSAAPADQTQHDDEPDKRVHLIRGGRTDWSFQTPSRFLVTIHGDKGKDLGLVLRRQDLTWRLTAIQLPPGLFEQ
ncbi:DUF2939 domain-containing protein [Solimonas marina]|uniref:DUF2939 domain-containing protein n=1 Tax=Solimonas marina TaxID=2714601 RepID=A0A970B6Q3_9GAMM|nr:DUF2939 domain-containing protein [Solimonas marina]NKF23063.1 DUF2939 domain-containing protein [Solimonas marina]